MGLCTNNRYNCVSRARSPRSLAQKREVARRDSEREQTVQLCPATHDGCVLEHGHSQSLRPAGQPNGGLYFGRAGVADPAHRLLQLHRLVGRRVFRQGYGSGVAEGDGGQTRATHRTVLARNPADELFEPVLGGLICRSAFARVQRICTSRVDLCVF